jgi:hypothetical protein
MQNPTTMESRPEEGSWIIRSWFQRPHDMDLRGSFTSAELRWLADRLDAHNEGNTNA